MRRPIVFFKNVFPRLFRNKSSDDESLRYRWRFRDFVWPHDITDYCVSYKDSGMTVNCTGVFAGNDAYKQFKNLASLFYQPHAGVLEIPSIGSYVVHFVKFELKNPPTTNYIAYECEFYQ